VPAVLTVIILAESDPCTMTAVGQKTYSHDEYNPFILYNILVACVLEPSKNKKFSMLTIILMLRRKMGPPGFEPELMPIRSAFSSLPQGTRIPSYPTGPSENEHQ